jgi:hypothetical protein
LHQISVDGAFDGVAATAPAQIAKTYRDGHKPYRLNLENGMIPFDELLAFSDKEVLGKVREILTKDEIALALAAVLAKELDQAIAFPLPGIRTE